MKFLKYLFFLLLIVFIGGAIYLATIDGNYQVEETRVIKAPSAMIYNDIIDLKTWEMWGPWKEADPNMVFNYPEKTSGVGASYSWVGDIGPSGSVETVDAVPNTSIDQTIKFDSPIGESIANVYWTFEDVAEGTKVTWGMKGELGLKEKAYWATQDSTYTQKIQPMFTEGLKKLDAAITEKMSEYSINVDGVTNHSGGFYMYTTTASSLANMGEKMAKMMPDVMSYMQQNNIPVTGSPMTIYNQWDLANNSAIFSSAIPTVNKVITPDGSPILCGFMPAQVVVKTTLKGNYTNLQEAWAAAETYIKDNNFTKDPTAKDFEIYRTDPSAEPNPANWVTEIYIPIISNEQ